MNKHHPDPHHRPAAAIVARPPQTNCPAAPSGVMFWLLAGLSAVVFTPCVLLPMWRDYQEVQAAERAAEAQVAAMEDDVARQRRVLDALHHDPVVIERVARRELGYARPGETSMAVDAVSVAIAPTDDAEAGASPSMQPPPTPWSRIASWLPEADYDALFCDAPTRRLLLVLSAVPVTVALLLFGASPKRRFAPNIRTS